MKESSAKVWSQAHRCKNCKDTGWLMRVDSKRGKMYEEYFVPCTCSEGQQRYQALISNKSEE